MRFKSIDDMVKYIEDAQQKSMDVLRMNTEDIAKRITEKEVGSVSKRSKYNSIYVPTGDIINCIKANVTLNLITLKWQDNGGWFNVLDKDEHVYAPWALEEGFVWDKGTQIKNEKYVYKPPTHFVDKTDEKLQAELPKVYLKAMKGQGIPLKRKRK